MGKSFHTVGEWVDLDENGHRMRFVKPTSYGEIIGGVLRHYVKGTEVECEPGLVQWEPYGDMRPLFSIAGAGSGRPISVVPFIVCEICGDKGWITEGKWHEKVDEEGVDQVDPMRVLQETNHTSGSQEGEHFDFDEFELAIRRDLGDVVLEEELTADRKLVDARGGGDLRLPDKTEEQIRSEHEHVFVGTDHDPQWLAMGDAAEEDGGPTQDPDIDLYDKSDLPDGGALYSHDVPPFHPEEQTVDSAIEERKEKRRAVDRAVLDSGHRHVFETGAQRDRSAGKGRFDLLQWMALPRVAVILEKGADKYEARNWEKGMPISRFVDSAARHLGQYVSGMTDEDHLGQAAWNLLSAIQTEEMIARGILPPELNDLPTYDPDHFDLTRRDV